MQAQKKHRLARRAKGLCGKYGCPEVSGKKYYCAEHAKQNSLRVKVANAARKAKVQAYVATPKILTLEEEARRWLPMIFGG